MKTMRTFVSLKVVLKPQITPKCKAWDDEKTQHTRAYVLSVRGGPLTLTEQDRNAEIYLPLEDLSARLRRVNLCRIGR